MIPDFDQALIERHMANYSDGWWVFSAGCGGRPGDASSKCSKSWLKLQDALQNMQLCSSFAPITTSSGSWKMLEGHGRSMYIYIFFFWAGDITQNNRSF